MAKITVEGSNFNIKTSGNTLEITFDTIEKVVKETVEETVNEKCCRGFDGYGYPRGTYGPPSSPATMANHFLALKCNLRSGYYDYGGNPDILKQYGTEIIHYNNDELMKTALKENNFKTVQFLWNCDPVKKNWKGIVKELMTVNDEIANFMYKVMCNDKDEGECIGRAFNAAWGKGFEKKPVKKPDQPIQGMYDVRAFRRGLGNCLKRGDLYNAKFLIKNKDSFSIANDYMKSIDKVGADYIAFQNFLNAVSKKYNKA